MVRPCASLQESEPRRALEHWLARNRQLHPEYRGGLSNHLSMALYALYDLGADAERLDAFAEHYTPRLEPFPAQGERIEWARWIAARGEREALYGYVQLFEARIAERGRDAVLREVLPVLIHDLSAAAFHCTIRAGYAVRFEDDAELAHALGYWAIEPVVLGYLPERVGTESDPAVLLASARESGTLGGKDLPGRLITEEMAAASRLEGFDAIAGSLRIDDRSFQRLASAAVSMYAATRDFTALHAVTATHAVRLLLPYVEERRPAVARHWQALLAAYVSIGTPDLAVAESGELPSWDALVRAAVASDDDHDVKLADSCRQEEAVYGGTLYRRAVARRLGLE